MTTAANAGGPESSASGPSSARHPSCLTRNGRRSGTTSPCRRTSSSFPGDQHPGPHLAVDGYLGSAPRGRCEVIHRPPVPLPGRG
ncbi:hypothetical protein ACFFX0_17030 [Citricoccus parietis]|uniref:Uncharacterized protein n=1 Tax=Citricoccus parietis TaxID=592307 RepID=A0ABV5G1J9_9MICC